MYKQGIGDFKYYVGISSLAQIATRKDRVCVLNILGGESSEVTPVGHEYSGGNVVFGTSPGRRGQVLETKLGNVPVYNNVREGLADGHHFNCGVIYLPPSAARDGVAELIRVNPDLKKIFMVTEKMSVHDAREIRAMGQANGIDIFGANCLGVADCLESGAHRWRAGRRLAGGGAETGIDCHLLQFRQLHDHDRHLPAHGGLGDDHAHLQRQGRVHPLRRARVRVRTGQ